MKGLNSMEHNLRKVEIRPRSDLGSDLQGAVVIIGRSPDTLINNILSKLELATPNKQVDLKQIDGRKSIGIDQIRELQNFISKKPFAGKYKAAVIKQAHLLTHEAQNALLKTLEEPPTYATIILCTDTENALLQTVLSRCQKIYTQTNLETIENLKYSLEEILKLPLGERLSIAEEINKEEKGTIIEILENGIITERQDMLKVSTIQLQEQKRKNINLLIEIKKDLEKTNVNTRLAFEYLVLNLV